MILDWANEKQPHFIREGINLRKLYGFDSDSKPPPSGTSGIPSKLINDPGNHTSYMTPLQLQSIYIAAGVGTVLLFYFAINNNNRRY